MNKYYIERCNNKEANVHSNFFNCLNRVENILDIIKPENSINIKLICNNCQNKSYYLLSNIYWPSDVEHRILKHKKYPSNEFIKMISNIHIIKNSIINPPIIVPVKKFKNIKYVYLSKNDLLKIDGLMESGSNPIYELGDNNVYTEHSGVLELKKGKISSIVINTDTNRQSDKDQNILLPINSPNFETHAFIYHTHPNTKILAGRIDQGILYEFPSASDIFNFIKYNKDYLLQSSIIIAPEGTYVIRCLDMTKKIIVNKKNDLLKYILHLEKKAITKHNSPKINEPNYFHTNISQDMSFIKKYNKYIESWNIYVEYYPREQYNDHWFLRPFTLSWIESEHLPKLVNDK
ncbi:MAG: hypothetical protein H0X03_09070 [Nitrosopumilus sp.]|nr:hypothetical protein [Nitrosopumilus sp.]